MGTGLFALLLLVSKTDEPIACARQVGLLAAKINLGSSMPGTEAGPDALIRAGIKTDIEELGFRRQPSRQVAHPRPQFNSFKDLKPSPNLVPILEAIHKWAFDFRQSNIMPIALGGDHSVAIATASASRRASSLQKRKSALIWFDAHSDMYYDQKSRGFAHGFALSQLLGRGHPDFVSVTGQNNFYRPQDVVLIGERDRFTKTEEGRAKLRDEGFLVITPDEISDLHLSDVYARIDERLKGYDDVHLSFDIDVVSDPEVTGFGFKLKGGLIPNDTVALARHIGETGKVRSIDFVELIPQLDKGGETTKLYRTIIRQTLRGVRASLDAQTQTVNFNQ